MVSIERCSPHAGCLGRFHCSSSFFFKKVNKFHEFYVQLICTLVSRLTLELERDKVISVSDDRVICPQKKM